MELKSRINFARALSRSVHFTLAKEGCRPFLLSEFYMKLDVVKKDLAESGINCDIIEFPQTEAQIFVPV